MVRDPKSVATDTPMNIDAVIQQIRQYSQTLAKDTRAGQTCVAGAAELAQIVDKAWLARPAAYVVPLADEPEGNVSMNGLDQVVTERIAVVVDMDNTADQRGQVASSSVETIRADLFRCLLNWWPSWANANKGFAYAGGQLVHMDRERLHWQFEFSLKIQITDDDGFIEPSVPITEVNTSVTDPVTGKPTPIGGTWTGATA
jgi:hypothetical protein